jgi:multiple antibiotic resistance protein
MNFYAATITLFLVMNPLGNIPVFISTLRNVTAKKRPKIILREAIFALIILTIFLFSGHAIIRGLQVSEPALSIAGGVILFIIALRLIFPPDKTSHDKPESEPFLVPLAVPLFAGPAAMATSMVIADQQPDKIWIWFAALVTAWFMSSILLLLSSKLSKYLGHRGLTAIERLMGMILTTLAVQMFLTGIQNFYHFAH